MPLANHSLAPWWSTSVPPLLACASAGQGSRTFVIWPTKMDQKQRIRGMEHVWARARSHVTFMDAHVSHSLPLIDCDRSSRKDPRHFQQNQAVWNVYWVGALKQAASTHLGGHARGRCSIPLIRNSLESQSAIYADLVRSLASFENLLLKPPCVTTFQWVWFPDTCLFWPRLQWLRIGSSSPKPFHENTNPRWHLLWSKDYRCPLCTSAVMVLIDLSLLQSLGRQLHLRFGDCYG